MSIVRNILSIVKSLLVVSVICGCGSKGRNVELLETEERQQEQVEAQEPTAADSVSEDFMLPELDYSDTREQVVDDHGTTSVRMEADSTISHPEQMRHREDCFLVLSKKDCYLYVYEAQDFDTVLLARYDCCFSRLKGQKERSGDMKTPSCTLEEPFTITEIADASSWTHDFGDGRGEILSYGRWFHRLKTPGHKGIGIHGSTNNESSVPGRSSEGCIRLRDSELDDLHDHYTFVGMEVVIKSEESDDYPFEVRAMMNQGISRKRHIDPRKALSNTQITAKDR